MARQVVSDVVVFRRASQAALIEHALAGNAAAQCLQGPLRQALEPAAAAGRLQPHKTVETTSLPMAPAGATDWFAYRLALTAAPSDPREHSFSIYDDLMGFRVGQDLVEINAYSARQLFPASQERDLLNLLYRGRRGPDAQGALWMARTAISSPDPAGHDLMLLGTAGIVASAGSLIPGFRHGGVGSHWQQIPELGVGLPALIFLSRSQAVDRRQQAPEEFGVSTDARPRG